MVVDNRALDIAIEALEVALEKICKDCGPGTMPEKCDTLGFALGQLVFEVVGADLQDAARAMMALQHGIQLSYVDTI